MRYHLILLEWLSSKNKDLLYGTLLSVNVAAWVGGEFEGEWIHVYVWLGSFAVCLKLHNIVNRL